MTPRWRYAFATVIGTSHVLNRTHCQDASKCAVLKDSENEELLVAVVADGAGSALHSADGSTLACELWVDEVVKLVECGDSISDISRTLVEDWVVHLQNELRERALDRGVELREFACTLLATVVSESQAVFVQIGDGAIVYATDKEADVYKCAFWPQSGEYASSTNFVTGSEARFRLEYLFLEQRITELTMFTDGIQSLALQMDIKEPHQRFFKPMLSAVGKSEAGYSVELTLLLADFLNSDRVNERTDDDKTLVLASRQIFESKDDAKTSF